MQCQGAKLGGWVIYQELFMNDMGLPISESGYCYEYPEGAEWTDAEYSSLTLCPERCATAVPEDAFTTEYICPFK